MKKLCANDPAMLAELEHIAKDQDEHGAACCRAQHQARLALLPTTWKRYANTAALLALMNSLDLATKQKLMNIIKDREAAMRADLERAELEENMSDATMKDHYGRDAEPRLGRSQVCRRDRSYRSAAHSAPEGFDGLDELVQR
jgi:hypothetical protein